MTDPKATATEVLAEHEREIDELHKKLAALPGCDKQSLAAAIESYKSAHKTFQDDALGCVGY